MEEEYPPHLCNGCGIGLVEGVNWGTYAKNNYLYMCRTCSNKLTKASHYKNGSKPMSENKECASYLGVYVAEKVLSKVFKDVEVMPFGNKGYDFICNKGKRIDVKSSCKNCDGRWEFRINRNTSPDYFLCIAFDNRKNLNPTHMWLVPSEKVIHLKGATISPSTIDKWNGYRLDTNKVVKCCDKMKEVNNG